MEYLACGVALMLLYLMVVLPFAVLVLVAFFPTIMSLGAHVATLTLNHFREILTTQGSTKRSPIASSLPWSALLYACYWQL
jgi:hypothetical protein